MDFEVRIKSARYKGLKLEKVLKNIRETSFDRNAIDLIVDVDYITVSANNKDGYSLTIIQKTKESVDIVEYFKDRFGKRFGKKNPKNKFYFVDYSISQNKSGIVSIVSFFYRYNKFEKALSYL